MEFFQTRLEGNLKKIIDQNPLMPGRPDTTCQAVSGPASDRARGPAGIFLPHEFCAFLFASAFIMVQDKSLLKCHDTSGFA